MKEGRYPPLTLSANMRRLIVARGISFAGGNAAFLALTSLVWMETHSASWVAAAALASFAVPAAVSPVAGIIGDRFDRRLVMVCSEVLGALCFVAMALAVAPIALLALRVLASIAAAPLVPASAAALPNLVPSDALAWANSRLSIGGTVGGLIGSLVAGILLTTLGASAVFLLNSATFLVSAALIYLITVDLRPSPSSFRHRRRFRDGFIFLFSHRRLRPVTLAYAMIFLGIGVTVPAEIGLTEILGAGPVGYAALFSLWAVGAICGAWLGQGFRPEQVSLMLITNALSLSMAFFLISYATGIFSALLWMTAAGACFGAWEVAHQSFIQEETPNALRSRVFAASEAAAQAGVASGLLFSGYIISTLGPRASFGIAGLACLVGLIFLSWGAHRNRTDRVAASVERAPT